MDKKPFVVKSCLKDLTKCKNIVTKLRSSLNPYKNEGSEWNNKELLDKVKRVQRDIDALVGMIESIDRKSRRSRDS